MVFALRRRPDFDVVGTAEDGRKALDDIRALAPDVALLDVQMPGLDGHAVLRAIERDALPTRVVLLSATVLPPESRAALAAGAMAYLSKEAGRDEICDAVAAAARGARLQDDVAEPAPVRPLLSPRELEVLRLTAGGGSAPAIGRALHLSPETIKTHLKNVYEKLGVSDRAAAVAEGMRRGLVE
ncbi:response regulator transcription factor [Baekduia soli]|uniref:Response regulator transcription factor n=1 Tax=Baekduia soli TaxID=496014 RepID=A0A5B8UD53_9ACTN|nr:response regulator transcription factor [Baekduia soli]